MMETYSDGVEDVSDTFAVTEPGRDWFDDGQLASGEAGSDSVKHGGFLDRSLPIMRMVLRVMLGTQCSNDGSVNTAQLGEIVGLDARIEGSALVGLRVLYDDLVDTEVHRREGVCHGLTHCVPGRLVSKPVPDTAADEEGPYENRTAKDCDTAGVESWVDGHGNVVRRWPWHLNVGKVGVLKIDQDLSVAAFGNAPAAQDLALKLLQVAKELWLGEDPTGIGSDGLASARNDALGAAVGIVGERVAPFTSTSNIDVIARAFIVDYSIHGGMCTSTCKSPSLRPRRVSEVPRPASPITTHTGSRKSGSRALPHRSRYGDPVHDE